MRRFNLSNGRSHKPLVLFMILLLQGGRRLLSTLNLSRAEIVATIKVMVVSVSWPGATAARSEPVADKIEKKLRGCLSRSRRKLLAADIPLVDFVKTCEDQGHVF